MTYYIFFWFDRGFDGFIGFYAGFDWGVTGFQSILTGLLEAGFAVRSLNMTTVGWFGFDPRFILNYSALICGLFAEFLRLADF